jgi:hypothetical protein
MLWHVYVARVGTSYHLLLNSSKGKRLYYMTSTNGTAWTGRASPALPVQGIAGENAHYRSCMIPVATPNGLGWKVWVSGKNDTSVVWRIHLLNGTEFSTAPPAPSDRSVFLPASAFTARLGSPVTSEIAGRYLGWLLDSATVESVKAQAFIQSDWQSVKATIYWSNAGAGTGDVAWNFLISYGAAGDDLQTKDAGPAAYTFTTAAAQYTLVSTDAGPSATLISNGFVAIQIQRRGTDAGDTLANDAAFLGVLLEEGEGY